MRLMVAGLNDHDGRLIFKALGSSVEHGGTLQDFRQLESAVTQARPDAVLLFLGARPGQALTMARRVITVFPNVLIAGMAEKDTPGLVAMATEAGLVDLIFLENGTDELVAAVRRMRTQRKTHRKADGHAVALLGSKGGVGTTTMAVNLAAELAVDRRKKVVVVDLHLFLGDVAAALDMSPDPSCLWFLTRASQADSKMWSEGPPRHRTGFQMLGLDGDLRNAEQINAEQVVFLLDCLRAHYDHVVVDCGSNLSEVSLAACSAADERLIVLTDELSSLLGARRRVLALQALELPPPVAIGVLNRSTQNSDLPAIEDASGLHLVAQVNNAWKDVHGAMERAQVLREAAPDSQVRADLAQLAKAVSGEEIPVEQRKKKAFLSFFR